MVEWASSCCEICQTWVINDPIEIGGMTRAGEAVEVEIDETHFSSTGNTIANIHHPAADIHHPAAEYPSILVFSGVQEEKSGKCSLLFMTRSTARTLLPLIQQHTFHQIHLSIKYI